MNVGILCLGVLSSGEASGYEIKKEIEDGLFSHFIDASYGSIYPALTQLAGEGLVTVRAEEQSGKPDKKVYAITPKGIDTLARSISVVPGRDKYKSEFLFQMLLQEYITPATDGGGGRQAALDLAGGYRPYRRMQMCGAAPRRGALRG